MDARKADEAMDSRDLRPNPPSFIGNVACSHELLDNLLFNSVSQNSFTNLSKCCSLGESYIGVDLIVNVSLGINNAFLI